MNDLVDTTEMYLRTIYDLEEGRGAVRAQLPSGWAKRTDREPNGLSDGTRRIGPVSRVTGTWS